MEPISLALGLTTLFSSTVAAVGRLATAKSYGKDYHLFVTKVETERLRLYLWGQAVGLTGGEELRVDPAVRHGVRELLAWAVVFFEDAEDVGKKHGVGKPICGLIAFLPGRNSSNSLSTTTRQTVITAFEHPRERGERLQKQASTLSKVNWAFSGKSKAERLVQELRWFVDTLYALIPISGTLMYRPTNSPRGRVEEIPQQRTTNTDAGSILRLGSSTAPEVVRNRMERRRLESSIRRRRMKHTRRAAADAAAETERKIRANER